MDVVGELERFVEHCEGGVVVDLVASEELLGGLPFAADAVLLFAENVV